MHLVSPCSRGDGDLVSLTLENVEADAAQLVDVGVEDLGQEADLGRRHRVVVGKEKLELEDAAWSSV